MEEGTFQLVPETLANDHQILHHFYLGGVPGDITEKCLMRTMKDELRLLGTVNCFRRGAVTSDRATMNFDDVLLMWNAATQTSLRTLPVLPTLENSLPRTSNLVSDYGFDRKEEQHCNVVQREDIDYKDIGLLYKTGGSRSAHSYQVALVLVASIVFQFNSQWCNLIQHKIEFFLYVSRFSKSVINVIHHCSGCLWYSKIIRTLGKASEEA